jgi:hypothetical protein
MTFGLIGSIIRDHLAQRAAARRITALGGEVWWRYGAVEGVGLRDIRVTEQLVGHLRELRRPYALAINRTQPGLGEFPDLNELQRVRKLGMYGEFVTDEELAKISGLVNLEELNLNDTSVTDAGLEHLKGLKKLKTIHLYRTGVTERGVSRLRESLPNLRVGWDGNVLLEDLIVGGENVSAE